MKPTLPPAAVVAAALALIFSAPQVAAAADAGWGEERAMPPPISFADAGRLSLAELAARGRRLFLAKFTAAEGAGRPGATGAIVPTKAGETGLPRFFRTAGPDSNACRGCHNDPEPGGAGDFVANAFVSEGFSDADFDTVDPQFSNERGTPALNGSGFVELLAREITAELRAQRRAAAAKARTSGRKLRIALSAKNISFGHLTLHPDGFMDVSELEGIDQDLVVRPFSQKGVFTSLRQFTINALNAHHGLQAVERFGARHTGSADFDKDGVSDEIGAGNITALVVFQALLPPPIAALPQDEAARAAAARGRALFSEIGCASCHMPALPLESAVFTEPGPYNPAGNLRRREVKAPLAFPLNAKGLARDEAGRILVPVFSDFKRHVIADANKPHFANELLAQRFVNRDVFLTARLWGVGDTAPYGHRGDLTTLRGAIMHHGGEAAAAQKAFEALEADDQRRIIAFLQSLKLAGAGGSP